MDTAQSKWKIFRYLFIFACMVWCACEFSFVVIEEMMVTDRYKNSYFNSKPESYERAFPILQRLFICMYAITAIVAAIKMWPKYFILSAIASLVYLIFQAWYAHLLSKVDMNDGKYVRPTYIIYIFECIALGSCFVLSVIMEFVGVRNY